MKTNHPHLLRLVPASLIVAVAGVFASSALAQSSWNWNGGTDGNWTTAANWTLNSSGGSSIPQGFLNFPAGASRTTITNNYAAGSTGYQIYFNSGASAYTIWGNSLTMFDWGGSQPVIQNDSANLQTVNFPVVFQPAAANLFARIESSAGNLTFGSTVTMNNNNGTAQFRVTLGSGRTLTFNGGLLEANGTGTTFALNTNNTVIFNATNTYTGDTFVNAGTLVIATNGALAGQFVRLGDTAGSSGANLNLNGGNTATNAINVRSGSSGGKIIANTLGTPGVATYAGSVFLDNPVTIFANTNGGGLTTGNAFTGALFDLKAQTLTVDGQGTNIISAPLTNSTGSGSLVKNGTGVLNLSGSNTYSGNTTINAGSLINSGGAIRSPSATLNVGAVAGTLGTFTLSGGSVTVQTLLATNVILAGATNSLFTFSGGTLTTSNNNARAATILVASNSVFNINGSWNMNAGTNITGSVQTNGGSTWAQIFIGNQSANNVVAVNSNATWIVGNPALSATNGSPLLVGFGSLGQSNSLIINGGTLIITNLANQYLGLGNSSGNGNNQLLVTNGGRLIASYQGNGGNPIIAIGAASGSFNNSMIVIGTNGAGQRSTVNAGGDRVYVGNNVGAVTTNNWLRVDQGGQITNMAQFISWNVNSTLILTNGGLMACAPLKSGAFCGRQGMSNNWYIMGADAAGNRATLDLGTRPLGIGGSGGIAASSSGSNNIVWVGQGGVITNVALQIGADTNGAANGLIITNGGQLFVTTTGNSVGSYFNANNNYIVVGANNALLSMGGNLLTIGNSAGANNNSLFLNAGGILTNVSQIALGGVNSALYFNGGTIFASSAGNLLNTNPALSPLNWSNVVQAGGLNLNDSGFALNLPVQLLHDPALGLTPDGGLTKSGSGTVALQNHNTYTGPTIVNAGMLTGVSSGSLSNSAITISAGATNSVQLAAEGGRFTTAGLTFNSGTTFADFNFGGFSPSTTTAPIQVNGNLTFNGTLNVIIRSVGVAPVGQYPLIKYTGSLIGTPPATVLVLPTRMTATLSNNVANSSIDLVVTAGNGVIWNVGNAAWDINTTASWRDLAGTPVNYLDGDAVILDDTASGASPITVTFSNFVNPSAITVNATNKSYTLTSAPGVGSAVSNSLATLVGTAPLIKNGTNTLTISATNIGYSGSITLNGGTLAISAGSSIGSGLVTMNNGTTLSLPNSGTSVFPGNTIIVPGNATATFATTALGNGIGGLLVSGNANSTINISGSVSFSATTRQLDSFNGIVSIPTGNTLRFSATSGVNGGTNTSFVVNGTLNHRNAGVGPHVLGSLSGSGTIGPNQTVAGTGTVTYQVGTNNASTTFSGRFVDFGSGPSTTNLAVTKMGTGTFTVSGNSPHSGATTIAVGALVGVTGGSFSNSTVTVGAGATNGVSITVANGKWICTNLTYSAGSTYTLFSFGATPPSTTTAPLSVLNNLTFTGTPGVIISGSPMSLGTYPLISYVNTLSGTAPTALLAQPTRTQGYLTNDTANKLISYVVTNSTGPLVWQPGDGLWDTTTANWKDQTGLVTTYLDGLDAVLFDETPAGAGPFSVTNLGSLSPVSTTVSNVTKQYTFNGGLGGSGALTKTGAGTLVLLGTNTFTGAVVVSGGVLQGNATSLNTNVSNNANVVFDQALTGTYGAVISGSGAVTKQNNGTLVINNTNTYNGGTTISAGTLQLGDGVSRNGAIAGNVLNNATLAFNNPNTQTFGGQISGPGTVVKNGSGTLNLGGNFTNTYTGLTTVNAGTLAFNSAAPNTNAIGGDLLINPGATVTYNTSRDEQIPGTANVTNNGGTISFGSRTETWSTLINLGGTNIVGSGQAYAVTGGSSTNGYFNITSSGQFYFGGNFTVANGYFDITYTNTATAGYRFVGPDNTGLIISSNAITATTFTNQGNAASGTRFLFGPTTSMATNANFVSVLNVQDIPGVDPDLNIGLKMTLGSGFVGSIRKDGNGKMAVTIPTSSGFTPTNLIVNEGSVAIIGSGTLYFAPLIQVNSGAILDFSGVSGGTYALTNGQAFIGNGTIAGSLTNGNSTFAPGGATNVGSLTISGSLDNSGNQATISFDLASSSSSDQLGVSGNLTLGGGLSVNLLNGFLPAPTDSFTIITNGGTLTGAFANLLSGSRVIVSNNAAYSFQVVSTPNSIVLTNFSLNAPSVAVTPASTNINYGASVSFATTVGGVAPFTYQWYDNATNLITGATNPVLTLNTPSVAASGNYRVIVANAFGTATNFGTLTVAPISSALALSSSANPAGYLDLVTFTAAVTPTNVTGTVTFLNGNTPFSTNSLIAGIASSSISSLARGTNTITAVYLGDVNFIGSTNSLDQVITNHAPTAPNLTFYRGALPTWKIKLTDLATNATDVDADPLTVTGFSTSTNGITLTTDGVFQFYVNANLVNDQFTYTVNDGFGGSATGTITLVSQAFVTGQNATVTVGGSTATVSFAGIPGFSYSVERSTNLVLWAGIWTTNAPANGLFNYTDDFSDLGVVPGSAYYRLKYNP